MPLSPQKREELRAEHRKFRKTHGLTTLPSSEENHWLDKFDQLLIEKQERIEKITKVCTNEIYNGEALISYKDVINILKE